jgi:hypothetical protein
LLSANEADFVTPRLYGPPMARDEMSSGRLLLRPEAFNGVQVFSATMFADRERLGDRVTEWLAKHRHVTITEIVVTQSSDASFHCVAISVFYREKLTPK